MGGGGDRARAERADRADRTARTARADHDCWAACGFRRAWGFRRARGASRATRFRRACRFRSAGSRSARTRALAPAGSGEAT
ncbi:hypothetical protein, partial [Streptomyces sp. McG3]|uniref:hypothetical protein n=1 Tax=Streptomyces sp. McG3 TaxID=2725483 RepID=UPI001BE5050D